MLAFGGAEAESAGADGHYAQSRQSIRLESAS
jgi:hypothetical protein